MAEIKIGKGEEPSEYTNHVMVRMSRTGTYQVSGASNRKGVPEHLLSRHFPTMNEAMVVATKWAAEQDIRDIHVYALDLH